MSSETVGRVLVTMILAAAIVTTAIYSCSKDETVTEIGSVAIESIWVPTSPGVDYRICVDWKNANGLTINKIDTVKRVRSVGVGLSAYGLGVTFIHGGGRTTEYARDIVCSYGPIYKEESCDSL